MKTKNHSRRLRLASWVGAVAVTATLAAAPADAATRNRASTNDATTIRTSAATMVLDTLQRAHLWLTTGAVLPAGSMVSSARQSSAQVDPSPNDRPDVQVGIKGYDWDSAGDDREN